jgi:hypothetical protein
LMFMTNWYWICFCVLKVMAIYQQVIPSYLVFVLACSPRVR